MKLLFLKFMCWIDDNINHKIENLFLITDAKFSRWLWWNISYKFCQWSQINLYEYIEQIEDKNEK